jgi:hypothetical protein
MIRALWWLTADLDSELTRARRRALRERRCDGDELRIHGPGYRRSPSRAHRGALTLGSRTPSP